MPENRTPGSQRVRARDRSFRFSSTSSVLPTELHGKTRTHTTTPCHPSTGDVRSRTGRFSKALRVRRTRTCTSLAETAKVRRARAATTGTLFKHPISTTATVSTTRGQRLSSAWVVAVWIRLRSKITFKCTKIQEQTRENSDQSIAAQLQIIHSINGRGEGRMHACQPMGNVTSMPSQW